MSRADPNGFFAPLRMTNGVGLRGQASRGSVLIIVIWVCLGLVALTLYFADSMSSELRAADNRVSELEAQQAVASGTRYAAYLLKQYATNGTVPRDEDIKAEELPVGDATFWFIGRNPDVAPTREPVFGLVDESSKLNLNTASRAMLEALPNMTPEIADAILTWRRRSGQATGLDAGDGTGSNYSRLDPPRINKGGPFESVDELRLVYGMTLDALYGEDTNRNGAIDPNEDDGEKSAPRDDQNGVLLAGIAEYVTVYSSQPTLKADGTRRTNIANAQARNQLSQLLVSKGIEAQRVAQILNTAYGVPGGGPGGPGGGQQPDFTSVADFMLTSRMTPEEFALIHADITAATGNAAPGLVNVNTASEAVLTCLPGIGENAAAMIAYRLANPDSLTSIAWLQQVLPPAAIRRAGPFITDQSYQFSADIAAVGRFGRGYARARVVYDLAAGTPRIVYRQDLTPYGWALGPQARQTGRTPIEI